MKTILSNIPAIVWWLLGGVLLLKILVAVLRLPNVKGAIGVHRCARHTYGIRTLMFKNLTRPATIEYVELARRVRHLAPVSAGGEGVGPFGGLEHRAPFGRRRRG